MPVVTEYREERNRRSDLRAIDSGQRFYAAAAKFHTQRPAIRNMRARNRPSLRPDPFSASRSTLARGQSRAQPRAPSCSLKEVSGQVEGKLGLGMQLTHLHGRPRNSRPLCPQLGQDSGQDIAQGLQLAPGRIKSLPDILARYICTAADII